MHTMNLHRCNGRATICLEGEIDLPTVPAVRAALTTCQAYHIMDIDVDLTAVTFCDVSGLNVFLAASRRSVAADGRLRLHHPAPAVRLLLDLTGTGFLLAEDRPPVEPSPAVALQPTRDAA
ncbi:STAS domain-containing protein [Streptomyces sp. NBC_00820]|uniref:STAS domain-containing protein n=1 Tax=Streptomyces sp. NBC_00820 TaxID=2975842 RepID=UPI002ED1AD1F|nr:STAS domain-containing protein [Streptomyces sp. NBC_00820]